MTGLLFGNLDKQLKEEGRQNVKIFPRYVHNTKKYVACQHETSDYDSNKLLL